MATHTATAQTLAVTSAKFLGAAVATVLAAIFALALLALPDPQVKGLVVLGLIVLGSIALVAIPTANLVYREIVHPRAR